MLQSYSGKATMLTCKVAQCLPCNLAHIVSPALLGINDEAALTTQCECARQQHQQPAAHFLKSRNEGMGADDLSSSDWMLCQQRLQQRLKQELQLSQLGVSPHKACCHCCGHFHAVFAYSRSVAALQCRLYRRSVPPRHAPHTASMQVQRK